jgi:hypothetical protein
LCPVVRSNLVRMSQSLVLRVSFFTS